MKLYQNKNLLSFDIAGYTIHISNIVLERLERSIPRHSHSRDSYEIHYISSGYGHANINNINYEIVPNTLYITGPFIEHEQIPFVLDPMYEYCIYLKIERNRHRKRSVTYSTDLNNDTLVTLETFLAADFWFGQDSQNTHELLSSLISELEHRYTGYTAKVSSLMIQLIVNLVRNYENKKSLHTVSMSNENTANQYLIIEECFLYEYPTLTLSILANRLHISCRQTERLLKAHYNKTFLQKKTESRMSAAAIMLSDAARLISDIADALGYSTVEHFSAAFKRHFNMSASMYRNSLSIKKVY